MKFETCSGDFDSLGVRKHEDAITFSLQTISGVECGLILYPKDGTKKETIPMLPSRIHEGIFSIGIKHLDSAAYDYNFVIDGHTVVDPYARKIAGREIWGDLSRLTNKEEIKSSFYFTDFNWKNDKLPRIRKQDMVMYKLHIRGFTMDIGRGGKTDGTVEAVIKKIPYLKELGITTLELMPMYEFEELIMLDGMIKEPVKEDKINYWGYTQGDYFAPKASYLGNGASPNELKKMIQKLHKNQIECIMEVHFDKKTNPHFIIECLQFWSREYHIDGFHLLCDYAVAQLAAQDLRLCKRKLFYTSFDKELLDGDKQRAVFLFAYQESFSYSARKMLNAQAGNLYEFVGQMKRQDETQGFVNFVTSNNGFTLYDLFSYTKKCNADNMEDNTDGTNWNYSSNCGQEGISRKKAVNDLRKKQVKNALALTFLAQGIPLIWMGDESGNSQQGNNNAYCQDNSIGWKNWKNEIKNKELLNFTKRLAAFRRQHPVLKRPNPMQMSDPTGNGYPDLSYHSDGGWLIDFDSNRPYIGIMYCANYIKSKKKNNKRKTEEPLEEKSVETQFLTKDLLRTEVLGPGLIVPKQAAPEVLNDEVPEQDFVYIAYNFQMVAQKFALPVLPKGMKWFLAIDTYREGSILEGRLPMIEQKPTFLVPRQSISVLIGSEK
ncbi:glycogen operon protein GlgX [Lachnospiraceae bacterium ZAX-1]